MSAKECHVVATEIFLTDGASVYFYTHAWFVVPFHRDKANKMCGNWTIQIMFNHVTGVSVACELLKGKRKFKCLLII